MKKAKKMNEHYLQQLEIKVNQKAQVEANSYLSKNNQSCQNYQKVFLIYKFDATPAEVIQQGLLKLKSQEELSKFYKDLAKLTHPDKNDHPLANQVFQKISHAYQTVMPKTKERDFVKAMAKQQKQNCR